MEATTIPLPIPASHPAFAGHFPGRPLLPGVVLIAEALEAVLQRTALAGLIGPTPTITQAKFLAPALPGSELSLRLVPSAGGRLAFEIRCGEQVVASGQFAAGAIAAAVPIPATPQPPQP